MIYSHFLYICRVTSNVIGRLKNIPVWFARCRHCRGFGVQSPWAYAFIRYVIGEKWSYYAYEHLDKVVENIGWRDRRLGRLFFRIANYCRSSVVLDFSSGENIYEEYIKAGSVKSRIVRVPTDMISADYISFLDDMCVPGFVMLTLQGLWRSFLDAIRRSADDRTLVVVRNINSDNDARQCWREIVGDERNIVTFDLYYCGIVFFDKKRYKQNYIVNF